MGMRVDYTRVSSVGQKLDVQLDRLSDCRKGSRFVRCQGLTPFPMSRADPFPYHPMLRALREGPQ